MKQTIQVVDKETFDKETNSIKNTLNGMNANIASKAPIASPIFTGSISLGRKSGTAVGTTSSAIGINTTASGQCSHAEGNSTIASGQYSHAEGDGTIVNGESSHAEGARTTDRKSVV